jgi:putative transposase
MYTTYHELVEISKQRTAAREVVRRVLLNNAGNVSETTRILGTSRKTVRRAQEGPLEDYSRRPKHMPRKLDAHFEELIVVEGKITGYGARAARGVFVSEVRT